MKCEAFDNGKWRQARITQLTPKSHNYPNGGVYIEWMDIDPNGFESKGGWMPMQSIRNYGNLSNLSIAGY